MGDLLKCDVCRFHDSIEARASWEIGRQGPWLLRHHPEPAPLLGWLLLDSIRHVGGPIEFNADEAFGWGDVLQRASALVRRLTSCDRVYAIAFGEGAHHLHVHLIPRFGSDPKTEAWSVADHYRSVASGQRAPADPAAMKVLVELARDLWP